MSAQDDFEDEDSSSIEAPILMCILYYMIVPTTNIPEAEVQDIQHMDAIPESTPLVETMYSLEPDYKLGYSYYNI